MPDPSAVLEPLGAVLPVVPDIMADPSGRPIEPTTPPPAELGDLATQLLGAKTGFMGAADREHAAAQTKAVALTPRTLELQAMLDGATAESTRRIDALEQGRPILDTPPSLGLHAYMAPVEGEPAEKSLAKLVTALGMFATGLGGSARGDARAGLAALTGAMEGWHAGDKERADRAFADYQAKTKAALQKWDLERKSYEDWRDNTKLSVEQQKLGLTLEATKHDNNIAAAALERGNLETFWKMIQGENTHAENVKMRLQVASDAKERADTDRISREERAVADRLSREQTAAENREASNERARQHNEMLVAITGMKVDAGKAVMKQLPADVRTALLADPEVAARIADGLDPTPEQIAKAEKKVGDERTSRAQDVGLNAANIPQRTPTESMKRLEDIAHSRSYLDEMARLARVVRLEKLVGGLKPFWNQIAQTGIATTGRGSIGIPISEALRVSLSSDERRFLALTEDYADTILRMRSGAAVTPSEFQRMLGFLPNQSVTPETLLDRIGLQRDLMRSKEQIISEGLRVHGYRGSPITPAPLYDRSGLPPGAIPLPGGGYAIEKK